MEFGGIGFSFSFGFQSSARKPTRIKKARRSLAGLFNFPPDDSGG
jgi:hypothetical protein